MRKFFKEKGQGLTEYVLILAFVASLIRPVSFSARITVVLDTPQILAISLIVTPMLRSSRFSCLILLSASTAIISIIAWKTDQTRDTLTISKESGCILTVIFPSLSNALSHACGTTLS